ncbi:hypothetical protein EON83_27355 [bacterium]|nr:MAG: hypothetical protein EON83_27355 [bacterium]
MSTSRKSLSKAEKSLFFVCVFLIVPLAAVVYVAGGRDADPKWNIPPAAPRPTPNGYDFYVAAAKATIRFKPEVDPASDVNINAPGSPYALKNYSVARRTQWLKANAKTFALVNQGLTTPSMAPDYANKPMGDWATLRQLARDMGARTRTFQMQKQPMQATMSALDNMQMGRDSTHGGGLISRLVGIAIEAIARAPLEDLDKTINELSGSEARTAARRLEALLAKEATATQTATVEKRDTLLELKRIFMTPSWRRDLLAASKPSVSQIIQAQTISKQTIYDNVNRALDAKIAQTKLPYSKAQKATLPPNLDIFSEYIVGPETRVLMNEARHTTSSTMLLLRLALRAYIAEHGAAPQTLSALVPSYLKSIPTDMYNDGKPLFYKPQGKTYKLWSVGPDMINNGGVPFTPRPGAKVKYPVTNTLDNKGDFVAGLCR